MSLWIAGDELDESITHYIKKEYNLMVEKEQPKK